MQDEGKLLGRGIAFPPRINSQGRWAWSAGSRNVQESIKIILLTELKERVMLPTFGGGLRRFLFRPNTVTTHRLVEETVTIALRRWEPRIETASVEVQADPGDLQAAIATIRYKLIATQSTEEVRVRLLLTT